MSDLVQDIRYGTRVLLRARGFTILAVLILGIGIGASTTLFSVINGVLLRSLPYSNSDRLVALRESHLDQNTAQGGVSAAAFTIWSEQTRTLAGLAAYRRWGFDLSGSGDPERFLGARVSSNLFTLLGVTALQGRTFVSSDGAADQAKVVVLSEELWRRRFGADARLLNASLTLNGQPHTVVGIVPAYFALPTADLWVPLTFAPYEMDQRGDRALSVIGRLNPFSNIASVRRDMASIARQLQEQFPASNAGWEVTVTSLQDDITGSARTPLILLFSATCLVLLMACANLANMLLARSTIRRREVALRVALGAGRLRIARQLVTENMLIVIAAAAVGLLMAGVCTSLVAQLDAALLPRSREIAVDPTVLGYVLLVSMASGAALAIIPVLDAIRLDLGVVIKSGSSAPANRWRAVALRDAPVIGQVALAFLLLVGGGLLVRSFHRAQSVDLGFSPENVLSMTVSLPNSRYSESQRRTAFFEELRQRVEALPGVRSAGLVSHLPLGGVPLSTDFTIAGQTPVSQESLPSAQLVNVTHGYFETMGIEVLEGRSFARSDRMDNGPVIVVDDTWARRFVHEGEALGMRVRLGTTIGADTAPREIIGIVAGVRATSPEKEPEPTIYIAHSQNPWPTLSLVIATVGEPERLTHGVISELRALDPNQPVYNVRSLDLVIGRTLASRRLQTLLMTGFAVAAFFLAVTSVYAMLSFAVAQRARELGIRVALGAQRKEIVMLCLRRGFIRIVTGLFIGAAASIIAARFVGTVLFGLNPWDPGTFAGALLLLATAGLIACFIPALRAARLDPLAVIRQE